MNKILFGAVKPEGALRASMERDMQGCIGHLEDLAPTILCTQQIYGRDRLTLDSKQAELGRKPDEHHEIKDVAVQYMWWNSESQSNWRDGYCRATLLLEDKELCAKVDAYIQDILSTQDADGYLGIYGPDLRYKHTTENGELWAKSTLYRVLVGYYEKTGDQRVLCALERALDELMQGYPMGASNPFAVENSFSGHCHGLTIVDVLHEMYQLTGQQKYIDYAVWLYENYSANAVSEEDMKIGSIEDPQYFWKNHGVHVYEHLRAVIIAAYHKPQHRHLLDQMLAKLPFYLTPSGGPIGDEWIYQRTADATKTGYEFCSVLELFDSYALLMEKSGDPQWADRMEWLYFNAGMGMKHPTESAIMYCKTDNCYTADRHRNIGDVYADERYKYSPVHQTTAVCCVPNMGRLTPHYVQNMYLKQENGFTAVLFGPSTFEHQIGSSRITVRQITGYPATNTVRFEITADQPVEFAFGIRVPGWATQVDTAPDAVRAPHSLTITRRWEGTQCIDVTFACGVQFKTDFRKDMYVTRGPLVYALPIEAREETVFAYDLKPFREIAYQPLQRADEKLMIHEDSRDTFVYREAANGSWREQSITGRFWDGEHFEERTMIPMGATILRKVTFPIGLGGKKK